MKLMITTPEQVAELESKLTNLTMRAHGGESIRKAEVGRVILPVVKNPTDVEALINGFMAEQKLVKAMKKIREK